MDTGTKELTIFWRKCGRLLDSGVPLLRTLEVIEKETGQQELREALGLLRATIVNGGTFEQGLAKSPALFPLSVQTVMKVAETTGRVDKVCMEIANGVEDGSLMGATAEPSPGRGAAVPAPGMPEMVVGGVAEAEIPVIKLASQIIVDARKARASDIHLENGDDGLKVRIRVDGVLRELQTIPRQLSEAVISRFKIMAGMNVTEKRLPQDGRIRLRIEGQEVDLRVSCIPCLEGENVVVRILVAPGQIPTLEENAFTPTQLAMVRSWLARSHGLILVTGPTGCGKTTTLYGMIQELNRPEIKILMAEDPVEYRLPGVSQLQIRQSLGLTFAAALRSFLRQDPDVIATTEIRDIETAQILTHAAVTGHLALSSLHTDNTTEALQRMIDVGVDAFLLSSEIIGVISQRLVRRVCPQCRGEYQPGPSATASLTLPAGARFYRGRGCEHCSMTGYRGRTVLHEMLEMNDALRKAIKEQSGPTRFRELAIQNGMTPLLDDGLAKASAGETTVEEVLGACR